MRDDKLIRAAVAVLTVESRRLRRSLTAPFVCPDLGQPAQLEQLLKGGGVSKKSWYRLRSQGWSVARIEGELDVLARVVQDEHRLPEVLLAMSDEHPSVTAEDVVIALALNYAREVKDGPPGAFGVVRRSRAETTASLLGLACDILIKSKSGRALTSSDIDRLRRHHRWLEDLVETHTSVRLIVPRINDNERRVAGLLTGSTSTTGPPSPGPLGDPSGSWAEGVIDSLVRQDRLQLCERFVRSLPPVRDVDYSGGLTPNEYWIERLAIRSMARPAQAPSTRSARNLGRRLADNLAEVQDTLNPKTRLPHVRRRADAVRNYLRGDWREALIDALAASEYLVRCEVEQEYGFSLLAAIAYEAAGNLGDFRDCHAGRFLATEIVRGRGPFMDAPIREAGEEAEAEVDELASVPELLDAVDRLVPQAGAEALDAKIWQLLMARAFNTKLEPSNPHDVLHLADALRERAAKIEGAATQLEFMAQPGLNAAGSTGAPSYRN
jgi:hypothetical protein